MSWYYNYYIGKKVDNEIELIGIYDNEGRIFPALSRSRSFASSLKDSFNTYNGKDIEELKEKLSSDYIKVLPYKDLPDGDFIKRGYFLIEDVEQYLKQDDSWDLFYDKMSPEVYAERLKVEQMFGPPKGKEEDDDDYKVHSCADYIYFAYPDYFCEEYEVSVIKKAVEILQPYNFERDDIVIVLSEG